MADRPTRRTTDPRQAAEAVFRKVAAPPVASAPKPPAVPNSKEAVTLRLDRDVLEAFQEAGAGWQDRINGALRKAAGLA